MSRRTFGALLWTSAVAIVVAVTAGVAIRARDPLRSPERRRWKEQAIATIRPRLDDPEWLNRRLAQFPASTTRSYFGNWFDDEILVMRSGEWMICQSVCTKEKQAGVQRDLFIGRGSDGRWYYSTFHFCVGKCVLRVEPQPDTLAQFVHGYWLAEFDGQSDDCLRVTWEVTDPYGPERTQR